MLTRLAAHLEANEETHNEETQAIHTHSSAIKYTISANRQVDGVALDLFVGAHAEARQIAKSAVGEQGQSEVEPGGGYR